MYDKSHYNKKKKKKKRLVLTLNSALSLILLDFNKRLPCEMLNSKLEPSGKNPTGKTQKATQLRWNSSNNKQQVNNILKTKQNQKTNTS